MLLPQKPLTDIWTYGKSFNLAICPLLAFLVRHNLDFLAEG